MDQDRNSKHQNWLACFEMVSQTNNKVEKEQKFFFQKADEETPQLQSITEAEYHELELL